jgi:hypothetical protein
MGSSRGRGGGGWNVGATDSRSSRSYSRSESPGRSTVDAVQPRSAGLTAGWDRGFARSRPGCGSARFRAMAGIRRGARTGCTRMAKSSQSDQGSRSCDARRRPPVVSPQSLLRRFNSMEVQGMEESCRGTPASRAERRSDAQRERSWAGPRTRNQRGVAERPVMGVRLRYVLKTKLLLPAVGPYVRKAEVVPRCALTGRAQGRTFGAKEDSE